MTDKEQQDAKAFSEWFAMNHLRFLKLTGQQIRDAWIGSTSPAEAEQRCEALLADIKLPHWIKRLARMSRRYDVPADHAWSKSSMDEQRAKGIAEKPALDAEINEAINRARDFIDLRRRKADAA